MIHAYHVIWGTYGFWLPNDPRGSWTEFIASWELARFGKSIRPPEENNIDFAQWTAWRETAKKALKSPAVILNGLQARGVGRGFAQGAVKSRFEIWACSILPEHVHLVIARHTYQVEQVVNLLKGAATKQLKVESLHPQSRFMEKKEKLPSMWEEGQWKVYLDNEDAIINAIRYVEENPIKEGKPPQKWPFIAPFTGIDKSEWTTYY